MHTPLVYNLTNQKLLLTALISLNDLKVVESIKVISFLQSAVPKHKTHAQFGQLSRKEQIRK